MEFISQWDSSIRKFILLTSTTILIAIYVVSRFGDMYIYVREFKWKSNITSRSPNRRSQGEGCTRAALRTFLQLSRTSMRFPSKPYERPSFFRRKGNQFSGKGKSGKPHIFTVEFTGPRNFQYFTIAEERRETIQREDCCLLDESAP